MSKRLVIGIFLLVASVRFVLGYVEYTFDTFVRGADSVAVVEVVSVNQISTGIMHVKVLVPIIGYIEKETNITFPILSGIKKGDLILITLDQDMELRKFPFVGSPYKSFLKLTPDLQVNLAEYNGAKMMLPLDEFMNDYLLELGVYKFFHNEIFLKQEFHLKNFEYFSHFFDIVIEQKLENY